MAPLRLDRFKAAVKDDLDKLPDRPKPVLPDTLSSEPAVVHDCDENVKPAAAKNNLLNNQIEDTIIQTRNEKITPINTAFDNLFLTDNGDLDSDDSEAVCPIEIVPVIEDDPISEPEDVASANHDVEQAKPVSSLGPEMRRGQVTTHGESFCPILALAKYPYNYVPKTDSQAVASAFFDNGQFWSREWDLFYVWPLDDTDKPIIFVREEQFVQLLKEIGAKFRKLHIDLKEKYFRTIKLVVKDFPDHPRLLPRYLGCSKSREDYNGLVFQAPKQRPLSFYDKLDPTRAPDDEQVADFNEICETVIDLNRPKSKGKKKKRHERRLIMQSNLSKQLRRAQRYFGLRKKTGNSNLHANASFSFDQQQAVAAQHAEVEHMLPLDVSVPAPYLFEDDIVIICVDIEAWERSSSTITEVGIATLDTRDVKDVPPGSGGENWRQMIRARHFRIREHMMYENHEFVQGAADRFEKEFGETEFINLKDAPHVVADCFKEPFSKPLTEEEIAASWEQLSKGSAKDNDSASKKRNIVFLGHNPSADIRYLHKLGYDPLNLSNLIETMDTSVLYCAHKKEQQLRSVGGILAEFGITGWNLHNAGNDAVYTLWIMLATVVAEACARDNEGENDEDDEDVEKNKVVMSGGNVSADASAVLRPKLEEPEFVVTEEYKTW